MTTGAGTGEADERREEIQKTRAELGETVQALAAKADPKALGRETTARARDRVREQAVQTTDTVFEGAVRLPRTAGQKAVHGANTIGQKALSPVKKMGQKALHSTQAISQKTMQGTKAARQKGGRGVEVARTSVHRAGGRIRAHPAASATIAAATIAIWSLQRRRRRTVS